MRIVCISDTHSMHDRLEVPEGDILIHAGDCLGNGSLEQLQVFNEWLGTFPHRHKVLIAGNHDWCFEKTPEQAQALVTNAVYLQDSGVTLDGLRFWGSPWTPEFMNWAFNLPRGQPLADKWALIPGDTDVLITHGPPAGILDLVPNALGDISVGCADLWEAVQERAIRLHVFGHIHEQHGLVERGDRLYVNASTCNERFRPDNPAIVVEL